MDYPKTGVLVCWGVSLLAGWVLSGCLGGSQAQPTLTSPAEGAVRPATETPSPSPSETAQPSRTPSLTPTLAPSPTPAVPNKTGQDGMHLIRIPAGEFRMGSDPAQDGKAESFEFPQHTLFVEDFWIDQTEVSNAQYARCVAAKKCAAPQKISSYKRSAYYNAPAYANYPVIWVSWEDARAYCAWVGRRLPGEAEWEKAARGPDGRIYPWGSQPPDCDLANFGGGPAYCVGDTAEVGSYPAGASLYGVLDMAGNVTEWVADWFSARYYAESPANNPEGPQSGLDKVMRGGDWASNPVLLRGAFRSSGLPSRKSNALGFRCAQTASK